MVSINSRLIDEYNYNLSKISYLDQINPEYVVLINTNTGATAGTNKSIKISLLKQYVNQQIQSDIDNKINESIKSLNTLTSELETKLNKLVDDNTDLNARVEALENCISLT